MKMHKLGPRQFDILGEIGNIGAAHAATALSTLLDEPVRISVTAAEVCAFQEIAERLGGPEEVVAGVYLRTAGDIASSVLFLLSVDSAARLVERLLGQRTLGDDFSELELSALAEVGNIMGGSYMNAVSALTALKIQQSVPAVAVDMAGAILDIGIALVGEVSDSAILINTTMEQGDSLVHGHFFVLPDPDSTGPLLYALGSPDD